MCAENITIGWVVRKAINRETQEDGGSAGADKGDGECHSAQFEIHTTGHWQWVQWDFTAIMWWWGKEDKCLAKWVLLIAERHYRNWWHSPHVLKVL